MFKSTADYDRAMVKILNCIISGDTAFKGIFQEYGDLDSRDAISECISQGYVAGMRMKDLGGQDGFTTDAYVRITYQGLKYLENNNHYKSNNNGSNGRQNP